MEKLIARWSYWLGIASLVIAVIWRAVNAFGLMMPLAVGPGQTVRYLSFFDAMVLSFAATIASACLAWLNSQKP